MSDLFLDSPYILLILGFALIFRGCGFRVYRKDVGTPSWFGLSRQRPK